MGKILWPKQKCWFTLLLYLYRNFRLYLTPRRKLFHKNVQVHVVKQDGERRKHGIHFERFYEGHLIGKLQWSYPLPPHIHTHTNTLSNTHLRAHRWAWVYSNCPPRPWAWPTDSIHLHTTRSLLYRTFPSPHQWVTWLPHDLLPSVRPQVQSHKVHLLKVKIRTVNIFLVLLLS